MALWKIAWDKSALKGERFILTQFREFHFTFTYNRTELWWHSHHDGTVWDRQSTYLKCLHYQYPLILITIMHDCFPWTLPSEGSAIPHWCQKLETSPEIGAVGSHLKSKLHLAFLQCPAKIAFICIAANLVKERKAISMLFLTIVLS